MRSEATRRVVLLIGLALPLGCFLSTVSLAQGQNQGGAVPRPQARSRLSNLDVQVNKFAGSLGLSEAQRSEFKRILEWRQQQILRLRSDGSISGGERIDRFRALQDKTVEKIRAILNEEQRKKYNPLAPRNLPPSPQTSVEDWMKATTPH